MGRQERRRPLELLGEERAALRQGREDRGAPPGRLGSNPARPDLAPQRLERVALDARQQAPLAPELPAIEAAAQYDAIVLERQEERFVGWIVRDRPERFEPPAQYPLGIARRLGREPARAGAARG